MRNDKLITLVNERGEAIEVELLCAFEIDDFNSKYIIYTKNERDREGHTVIYSGKIELVGDKQCLVNIENEDEWSKIKEIMKEMARYSIEVENNDR